MHPLGVRLRQLPIICTSMMRQTLKSSADRFGNPIPISLSALSADLIVKMLSTIPRPQP
jgi:hypothetical protein